MNLSEILSKLWKPLADSKAGSINWKELALAGAFGMIFFLGGGNLNDFIKGILENYHQNTDLATNIEVAIVTFVTAYLHRTGQGAGHNDLKV